MGIFIEDESQASPAQALSNAGERPHHRDAPKRMLHVVARTYGDPHQWFYRKLTTTREWHEGIWSPWEKIDADVTGDHVLPVVWNHHLYLFWALFEQKADKPTAQERKDKDNPRTPRNRWYIKFAWSECRNGKWSPKRVSKETLKHQPWRLTGARLSRRISRSRPISPKTASASSVTGQTSMIRPRGKQERPQQSPPKEGYPSGRARQFGLLFSEHTPTNPKINVSSTQD